MRQGDYVVVDGRAKEVLQLDPSGDMLVRDISTLELKWVDFYVVRTIDPREEGLLLDALGALSDDAGTSGPEEGAGDHELTEELPEF